MTTPRRLRSRCCPISGLPQPTRAQRRALESTCGSSLPRGSPFRVHLGHVNWADRYNYVAKPTKEDPSALWSNYTGCEVGVV